MIINHNMASLNTYNRLSQNNAASASSLQKLSSGLRINKAGDDAAGLAISEKMRAQVRGLDQASRNSQDGISMIQTAEGGLSETHAILQRMRELATQAANDTNVGVDRNEIQKEINQLSSEINRIGNTTEFNTQSLLKGDGKTNLTSTGIANLAGKLGSATAGADAFKTAAKDTTAIAADVTQIANADDVSWTISGQTLKVEFTTMNAANGAARDVYGVTATGANINATGAEYTNDAAGQGKVATDVAKALQAMIDANDTLKGNYVATASGTNIEIKAVAGSVFDGAAGNISNVTANLTTATATNVGASTNAGTNTAAVAATKTIDLSTYTTKASVEALVGKGMTVNGTQVEFYDASKGVYTGNAKGIDLSFAINSTGTIQNDLASTLATQLGTINGIDASAATSTLTLTAATAGAAGNNIEVKDGGIQEQFKATFQVGANKGQSFTIDINDMRANALKITGKAGDAGFTTANNVTDGTSSTVKEAALDVSSHTSATAAIKVINDAIETVSAERSKIGAFQNRLEHTIANLGTSSENLTAAESRVRDVDMAKEMMNFQKNNILSQAAQAMLAQANQQPQGVLQLLR